MTDDKTTKRYYITTPIYYVNGVPHVGTATTTVLCDAVNRYRELRGDNPYFLTGTDEHALKVAEAAAKAGKSTQEFVDEVSCRFLETWKFLNIEYDVFFRTTEARHQRVVQEVFRRLQSSGDVYLGEYEGWYSVADETFYRDSDVDKNGIVKETGAKVERIKEEVHYFRLSAYGDRLREHITANPGFLLPDTRRNEVLAFIDQGLRDLAISRRTTGWGIPVPGDESKVIYVWFDALINYLTESGWPDNPDWPNLWPADVHLMAKEIYTRFHATLWPAMLFALGLPLPKHVVGHGWWLVRNPATLELTKGSKSGVPLPTPEEAVAYIQERSGAPEGVCVDALRYYLARDIQFTADSEFSYDMLVTRYNSDLANDLGNVLNRVLRAKYFEGRIPEPSAHDDGLKAIAAEAVAGYEAAMERFDWGAALQSAWTLVGAVNKYLDEKAPWSLAKNGEAQAVADVIYNALEGSRLAAVLVSPVMPTAAREIARQLGIEQRWDVEGSWAGVTRWGGLVPGTPVGEPTPLFPRIDTKKTATDAGKPQQTKQKDSANVTTITGNSSSSDAAPAAPAAAPQADLITIDDFARIQLRIADILAAERIEGAKKLLRLQIRIGDEERQIVAGIAETYAPEDLPGKQIAVVANLQPATIRGVQSQGMLLAATNEQGQAILLHPDKQVTSGSRVK